MTVDTKLNFMGPCMSKNPILIINHLTVKNSGLKITFLKKIVNTVPFSSSIQYYTKVLTTPVFSHSETLLTLPLSVFLCLFFLFWLIIPCGNLTSFSDHCSLIYYLFLNYVLLFQRPKNLAFLYFHASSSGSF